MTSAEQTVVWVVGIISFGLTVGDICKVARIVLLAKYGYREDDEKLRKL